MCMQMNLLVKLVYVSLCLTMGQPTIIQNGTHVIVEEIIYAHVTYKMHEVSYLKLWFSIAMHVILNTCYCMNYLYDIFT